MIQSNQALESAIMLWRAPRLARRMRSRRLPEGVIFLLQILSREDETLAEAKKLTRLNEDAIVAIVELYVLQVMLFRGAPAHRVLGVEPGAERSQSRRHMGYLMGWLHPDKEANPWRLAYARRVLEAWHQIEKTADNEGPQVASVATITGRGAFLIPWIAVQPQKVTWGRFPLSGIWRSRKQLRSGP
jgi:hypothetical protein